MKFFLSFLVALSLVSVAESWAPSDRSLAGRRATAPKTNTQLRDLIDGNVQWYSTTSANSPAVTKDAVNRNLKAAAKQFMRYQSGYFSPMTPNENMVNNNRNMNGMGDNTNNMNGNYNYNYNTYSGGVTYSGGYYSNNYNQNTPNNYQNNNINNNRNANYQNNNNNFNRNANYQNNNNNFNGNNNYQNNNNRNNNNNFNRNNNFENKNNQNRNFNNFKYNDPRYNILADDFVFGSPVIGPLNKWDYIDGIDYFKVYEAFPDINPNCYGFSIDLVNPLKVRFFVKATGTYQNKLGGALGKLGAKPDGRQYMGSTEAWSITFNERMQVRAISAGYVVDRFENKSVCTTDGKGLTLGVLHTTGVKSLPTDPGSSLKWLSGLFANGGSDGLFPKTFSNSKELPQWWTESRKAPN